MLPSHHRLRKQKDFDRVFKQGRYINGPLFNVKFNSNGLPSSRFAFVVSAKTEKRATKRNSVKRRLRAVGQELLKNIKPGFDIVVLVKKPSLDSDHKALADELGVILKRAKLT